MAHDLIVIGAGPAGMTAAATAAECGLDVVLLDDQAAPGGQIYRGIETSTKRLSRVLGPEYGKGREIAERFRASGAGYLPETMVWQVTDDCEIACSGPGGSRLITAANIVLATGAIERPFPVPGWTLPGVLTAGGAQTLVKTSGLAAEGAVFAGCGPLLYLVAAQYVRAGIRVAAILETTAQAPLQRAVGKLSSALKRFDLLWKGQLWLAEIRRSGTPVIGGVTDLRIEGNGRSEAISYTTALRDWRSIETPHVFLHQGVVPNVNLSMSIGLAHHWHEDQLCWHPTTDTWGQTSNEAIFIAGDGGGISGAVSAAAAGEICALQVATRQGGMAADERDRRAEGPLRILEEEQRIRPFLDAWFRPADQFRVPADPATIVCRCEEITRAEISEAVAIGLAGPNQLKSFTRAGMGPCQGRLCGLTVQEVIASETGRSMTEVGYYRLRPPIKPVRLQELADLQTDEPADEAAE